MPLTLSGLLAEPPPLPWFERRSWLPWFVVGLVCIGAFVGQLDATIVQLALPTLGRDFNAPPQQVSWVALAYLVAFASFLPVFGRLCEMFGRKNLYIAGYVLFAVASALCGFATSFDQLLVFRFIQGIGGSLLGANSIAILVKAVPDEARGRALGYFSAAQAVGMSAGPALGGILLEALGWRWIFWITVPFAAAAMIVGWLALPRTATTANKKTFDWGGSLLIGPALILLVATLNQASVWGLASPMTLGSFAVCLVLLWLLVRRERASPSPLIAPLLFQSFAFRCGALAVTLAYALLYGIFFLMSFALEHGYGESPAEAGLRLAIVPVAIGLSAPFSSQIRERVGKQRVGVAGMLLCLASIALLLVSVGESPHHRLLDTFAFILVGVGLGIFIAPNNSATLATVPEELCGVAGSLLNLMRVLGTCVGVAAGATMLTWRLQATGETHRDWASADSGNLLAAVHGSIPILVVLAIAAAITSHIVATSHTPAKSA